MNDPGIFRKGVLEETLRILKKNSAAESAVIETAFKNGIKNPRSHRHPEACEYFLVKCTAKEAGEITRYLFAAEAMAVPPSGETTAEAAGVAHLIEIWAEFRDWLASGGERNSETARRQREA